MKSILKTITAALLALPLAALSIGVIEFTDAEEEQRFRSLTEELRCLVCQNQNIADSGAGLADDLKTIVLEQIRAGKTDQQIKDFLVQRYGEYVLYDPPLQASTMLLWFGPLIVVLVGGAAVAVTIRRRAKSPQELTPDPDQEEIDKQLQAGDW